MTVLFNYPESTVLKRVIPKSRIYAQIGSTKSLKDRFINEVEKITWSYKLAPETVNLPATKSVTEIQVFQIKLKEFKVSDEVLRAVDLAIPFPIIFELLSYELIQVAAAHKRPSDANRGKWIVANHLRSEWMPQNTERSSLPLSINMASLYDQILTELMPIKARDNEDIMARLERANAILAVEREIKQLESKLKRETQFNLKVELHGHLKYAQTRLVKLMHQEDLMGMNDG